MPRRSILSASERESLLALLDTKDELVRHYTFSDTDLPIIRQRRGPANRRTALLPTFSWRHSLVSLSRRFRLC